MANSLYPLTRDALDPANLRLAALMMSEAVITTFVGFVPGGGQALRRDGHAEAFVAHRSDGAAGSVRWFSLRLVEEARPSKGYRPPHACRRPFAA